MQTKELKATQIQHPLDPLTADEITQAVKIMKEKRKLKDSVRFVQVVLHEPAKETVLNFQEGNEFDREAFMILLDNQEEKTYEAVVSITKQKIVSFEDIPNVQPQFLLEEFEECERLVRDHPDYQAALLKRGVTDPE